MSQGYKVYVEEEAIVFLLTIPKSKRKRLQAFIRSLADSPFNEADFPESDLLDRKSFCKVIDEFALSFYPDHAVKEVKVFEIVFADA